MGQNQYGRLSAACVFALLIFSSPARAVSVPSAEEDGLGHFLGCFSVLLDSIVHAQYCGPSRVPMDLKPVGTGGEGGKLPVPPCAPCEGTPNLASLPALDPYQVASLSYGMLPVLAKPSRWEVLMACCPVGNS